ncbi:hypothetical protein H0H92_011090 [Tricholoma furcatifolium]|nr:hypothetical protein H0H92_011090 [Tricholoma furcatifolium]
MATVHASGPSENWDDDFEFNPLSRKNTTINDATIHDTDAHRMSIASSDWDHDDNDNDHHNTNDNTILEDRTNQVHLSPAWIEPGPSTPRRTNKHEENWDDDFEDSPVRKAFPSPPGKDKVSPSRLRRKEPQQPRPESWDEEFEAQEARASHSDEELGFIDEEDRTVTARSRRGPARLSSSPPPVPALPLPFLLPDSVSSGPSPFPRSPTSSVFSVPTARPPSSAFTVTSTTHLHPTTSRSSSALSNYPPSPPIQKERERRRLRKKSRPQGTAIELAVIHSEYDGYDFREETEFDRPTTPPPPPQPVVQSTPASPSGAGALLSRIGSVKKWGVRRRKGSTAPSEVDDRDSHITPRPARPQSQASITSIPSSSGSSNAHQTHHPPLPSIPDAGRRSSSIGQSASWFFRSSSSTYAHGSTSEVDLPAQPQTPTKNRNLRRTDESAPAKLVKKKSMGFVQLKLAAGLGIGGHGNDSSERGKDKSQAPVEKYGGLGLGRAADIGSIGREPSTSRGDKHASDDKDKDGARSFMGSVRRLSLVGTRHKRTKSGVSLHNVKDRLDIVGLAAGLRDDNVTPTPESVAASRNVSKGALDTPTKTPKPEQQTLLPPIDLQPPSPPRVRPAAPAPDSEKHRPLESMLSPSTSIPTITSTPSSPTPSTTASPSRRHIPALGSPQAASLGRSTIGPESVTNGGGSGMRRSSLGDLKIPERISQAQVGLRKDMERVREFAAGIERKLSVIFFFSLQHDADCGLFVELKELHLTYQKLVGEVQAVLDQQHLQQQQQQLEKQQQLERQNTRSATPNSFFANLPRPMSRNRSNTTLPPPSASTISLAQTLALSPSPASAPAAPSASVAQTYKQLASAYYTIRSKYRISWECAELLIELGSGSNAAEREPPSSSVSAPVMPSNPPKTGRERAITLNGEDSKPPTPVPGQDPSTSMTSSVSAPGVGMGTKAGWRASTGKHDLSQRQLVLLKEILNGGDGSGAEDVSIPEENIVVNREWRWGMDAMSSTVTLPSEDSSAAGGEGGGEGGNAPDKGKLKKKRRASRLGMAGLRDILRSLTRSQDHHGHPPPPPMPMSTTSLSTTDNSSIEGHRYPHPRIPSTQGRRRAKTSSGPGPEPERIGRPTSPYSPSSLRSGKPSPRRPSLASIFRLGQKNKPATPDLPPELREFNHYGKDQSRTPSRSASRQDSCTGDEEEDWDRMDDASEDIVLGRAGHDASATVREKKRKPGRSPYLQDTFAPSLPSLPGRLLSPKRSVSGSRSSIWGEGFSSNGSAPVSANGHSNQTTSPPPLPRSTKLSDVEEHVQSGEVLQLRSRAPPRATSRQRPPPMKTGSVRSMPPHSIGVGLPDPMLAMTPENIRPLLENAKEVQTRLIQCIEEVKALLEAYAQPGH